MGSLSDRCFLQRYRMDKATFAYVCETIRDDIEADQVQSSNARGGAPPITAEIMLSAMLRFFVLYSPRHCETPQDRRICSLPDVLEAFATRGADCARGATFWLCSRC